MKKKLAAVFSVLLIILSLCACGETQYDRDLNSGMDKFKSGNSSSMTKGEREAVNNFFEWQSEQ